MIIRSILCNDLYKFTMMKAALRKYPNAIVAYGFNDRRPSGLYNDAFGQALRREIDLMGQMSLLDSEADWLHRAVRFLGGEFIEYLRNFRFNPKDIEFEVRDGQLRLKTVRAPWPRLILWEVPLLALISELYFKHCDSDWTNDVQQQREHFEKKRWLLREVQFSDFGTRRRRNFETQDLCVEVMKKAATFRGTSNVFLAKKHGVKPMGTMAHEWFMAISALEGIRHANRHGLNAWSEVFDGDLGIALPDTFGTEAFFGDFDGYLARLFDGVRHDSGDPLEFGDKVIAHYESLGINPMTRVIIFSDALDCLKAMQIADYFRGRINVAFGIGTNFTNSFENSPALNIVIKMTECNGVPVVKLSDTPSKAIGDPDALRVARWTFFNTPLDTAV